MADFRSAGQHDVDRILYSSAYRRLSSVTQVVAVGERQLFHNRLTHTQKVAQLSRRIAQYLNWHPEAAAGRAQLPGGAVDPDVAEAAGLAHDLGHPPFGHIAERALDERCRHSNLDGYEGNAQSFRIVTKLTVRRLGTGLSLSPATLNAILKYPWMSDDALAGNGKWGAYQTERDLFEDVRGALGAGVRTVEAQIMDWADGISYAVHDLEDFYRAGFIQLREVSQKGSEAQAEFVGKALDEWHDSPWDPDDALSLFEELMLLLPPGLGIFSGTRTGRAMVNRLGSEFIDRYVSNVRLTHDGDFRVSDDLKKEIHLLKQLTWQFVINEPSLATLQQGQILLIEDLFDSLHDWSSSEKRKQRLPTRFRDLESLAADEDYDDEEARTHRVIADYISSLTEDQAVDLHARLRGRTRGSIQDSWVAY